MSRKFFYSHLYMILASFLLMACQSDEINAMPPTDLNNTTDGDTNTLIVYYSYTNHTEQIVADLRTLINADVIEVEPVDKALKYEANNYAIGTEQLNKIKNNPDNESSYPAIEDVAVDMNKYTTVIIATPLWWSQMASNMQTFLFKYASEMAGKNIGLIVSSASSGIPGVEADAKRLLPNGKFMSQSLWINSSRHSQRKSLMEQWLKEIDYNTTALSSVTADQIKVKNIYAVNGQKLADAPGKGVYIENGVKKIKTIK